MKDLLIFLILLTSSCISMIIERNLAQESEEDAKPKGNIGDVFFESVKKDLEDEAKSKGIQIEEFVEPPNKIKYIFKDRNNSEVEIEKQGGKITIDMKNDYETVEVISENLNYEDQKELIFGEFVQPYIEHLEEIMGDDIKKAFEKVEEGIKGVSVQRTQSEEALSIGAVTIKNEDAKKIDFKIDVNGTGMQDGILGTFEKEGNKGYNMRLFSKYFQNTFILNVETANYVQNESKKMITLMLKRLDHMITLNEPESEDTENTLTDEKMEESFKKSFADVEAKGGKIEGSKGKFKISNDKGVVTEIEIKQEEVSELPVYGVNVKLVKLNRELKNKFLTTSLYEMIGVVDAFFDSVARLTKLSMQENGDEYVAAFKSEEIPVAEDETEKEKEKGKNKNKIRMKRNLKKLMIKRKI